MTGKTLWQQIKDVVECDQKITALATDIQTITQTIAQEEISLTNYQKNLDKSKKALFDAQKNANLAELSAKEIKESEERKLKLLDNAREQKEYMALKREIETLSQRRIALDESLIKQWYDVERLKDEVHTLDTNKDEQVARISHDIAVKKENVQNLTTKRETMQQERERALALLPAEWISKYQRMQESVPDPIVPVVDGNCSSCFYTILHHDLSKLKAAQVLICRSCYRFLYYDVAQEKQSHEASY